MASQASRHSSDPLQLRFFASIFHLPEWLVAYVASLSLTAGMSLVQFLLVAPLLRAGLRPLLKITSSVSQPLLQPLWTALVTHEPLASWVASPVFPGVTSAVFYFMSCLPFAVVDWLDSPSLRARFKHQPSAPQRPDAWAHALFLTGWHHVFYIFPGLITQIAKQGPWLYVDYAAPGEQCMEQCDGHALLPSVAPRLEHIFIHLAVCFLLFDASCTRMSKLDREPTAMSMRTRAHTRACAHARTHEHAHSCAHTSFMCIRANSLLFTRHLPLKSHRLSLSPPLRPLLALDAPRLARAL